MPRRGGVPKRNVLPDPVYNSEVITKLTNQVMYDGKLGTAQKIVYSAFDIIKNKTGNAPDEVFFKALENVNNYRVSKETRRVEDYDLWMRLYKYGYKIYNIQEELYSFREDEKCLKRRKYKYRIDEVKVRYYGFKSLGLFPKGYLYVLKPLIVGLIPYNITKFLKNKFRKENVI